MDIHAQIDNKASEVQTKLDELLTLNSEVTDARNTIKGGQSLKVLRTRMQTEGAAVKVARDELVDATGEIRKQKNKAFKKAMNKFSKTYKTFNKNVDAKFKPQKQSQIDNLKTIHAELMSLRAELEELEKLQENE